jgi:hypothetical protein
MNKDNIVAYDPYVRNRESDDKQYRSVQSLSRGSTREDPSSPVLRFLERKAAATWTGGAYEGLREHGQGVTCLLEAAPAKAGNAAGLPAEAPAQARRSLRQDSGHAFSTLPEVKADQHRPPPSGPSNQ